MTDAIPITAPGVKSSLGNWKDPKETRQLTGELFDGCMKGESINALFRWEGRAYYPNWPLYKEPSYNKTREQMKRKKIVYIHTDRKINQI